MPPRDALSDWWQFLGGVAVGIAIGLGLAHLADTNKTHSLLIERNQEGNIVGIIER